MDFQNERTYELELWSSHNRVRVADISNLAQDRGLTLERNEAEEIRFNLDLYAIESLAANMGTTAAELLMLYQMDVLVKRDGQYWFGTQIVSAPLQIGSDYTMSTDSPNTGAESFNPTITVNCRGYLDLFKDRHLTGSYTGQDRTVAAGNIIMDAQAVTNGDVGVTLGPQQYLTGTTDGVRTLERDKVKHYLQNLTQLPDGRFDFEITYDKQFQTYAMLGSDRTDVQFTFGGPSSNIIGLYLERSASKLYNRVIGLGYGFGADQLVSGDAASNDEVSQLNNFLREGIFQHNNVEVQEELDKRAAADLALSKDLLQIPQITISGAELQGKDFLHVGDRIPLRFVDHNYFSNVDGLYRIEKMVVAPDDNDFEKTIELYFDNFDLESD